MYVSGAAGHPPLPLAAESVLAQEIDAGNAKLEKLQSFSTGSKDGKQHRSTQSKINGKNSASRSLFEYAHQTRDSTAVLQHSLDTLSNETATQLEKCGLK